MTRPRIESFVGSDGYRRVLRDPDGEPTGAQLRRLNREGRLELVPAGDALPLTKGEAAFAIGRGDDPGRSGSGGSSA